MTPSTATSLRLLLLATLLGLSTGTFGAGKIPDPTVTVYFGLGMPDGEVVSEAQWNAYLDEVLIPAFPGFTVIDAQGVFNGRREPTRIVNLRIKAAERNRLIEAVRAYAARFEQMGVLITETLEPTRTIVGPEGVLP